jgi:hypothetical protein
MIGSASVPNDRRLFAQKTSTLRNAKAFRRGKRGRNPTRTRLQIEVLEDRLAPAQLIVTSALDPASLTAGTLRYAVNQANTVATACISDTIKFNTAQMGTRTIMLQKGLLDLKPGTITIDGGGSVAISGNNASGIFQADSGARVTPDGAVRRKERLS